ncbi:MAG: outer membrane beta-barrel protein [Acidobacteriota bacterium]
MMKRTQLAVVAVLAACLAGTDAAYAQQGLNVQLGYFSVRGEDGRVDHDVIAVNRQYLLFDVKDYSGFTLGGEWTFPVGEYLEGGVGVQFYQRTVPSVYADWVYDDGREIAQDVKLRNVPVTATIRILPFGRRSALQPYVGGGVGINVWRYSETGDFVDFTDGAIFRDAFVGSGTAVGPVGIFGIRGRVAPQFDIGFELRYQWAEGTLGQDFLDDRIDLGGFNALSVFRIRF